MKRVVSMALACTLAGSLLKSLPAETEGGILRQTRRLQGEAMRIHEFAHDGTGNAVAVGINGTIRTSTDHGNTWSAPTHPSKLDLRAVCSSGSLHVTNDETTGIATIEFPEVLGSRPRYFTRLRSELEP